MIRWYILLIEWIFVGLTVYSLVNGCQLGQSPHIHGRDRRNKNWYKIDRKTVQKLIVLKNLFLYIEAFSDA